MSTKRELGVCPECNGKLRYDGKEDRGDEPDGNRYACQNDHCDYSYVEDPL